MLVISAWSVVVVVVVACCNCCCIPYRLALMLAPDLCTLCPDLCTLHPDLWTLCLWCFPSFKWCKHSTCTGGGCHQLQLAPVVIFIQSLAQIVHLHTWWYHPLQLARVVLFHPSTGANTVLAHGQLALCGGLNN